MGPDLIFHLNAIRVLNIKLTCHVHEFNLSVILNEEVKIVTSSTCVRQTASSYGSSRVILDVTIHMTAFFIVSESF